MPSKSWLISLLVFLQLSNNIVHYICDDGPILALSYFAKVSNQNCMAKDPFHFLFLSFRFILKAFYLMKNQKPHCCTSEVLHWPHMFPPVVVILYCAPAFQLCSKTFFRLRNVRNHIRTHDPKLYKCRSCIVAGS